MAKEDEQTYPSQTADRYIVRFPEGMRDRLKDAAAANNRSMNAEIVARLEESFARSGALDMPAILEQLEALVQGKALRRVVVDSKVGEQVGHLVEEDGLLKFKPAGKTKKGRP